MSYRHIAATATNDCPVNSYSKLSNCCSTDTTPSPQPSSQSPFLPALTHHLTLCTTDGICRNRTARCGSRAWLSSIRRRSLSHWTAKWQSLQHIVYSNCCRLLYNSQSYDAIGKNEKLICNIVMILLFHKRHSPIKYTKNSVLFA